MEGESSVRAAVGRSVGCVLRWLGCWCRGGRRMAKHRHELFIFVREPAALPDNNEAERALRQIVMRRKISGGTRSTAGSETKMTLASLFGTWRRRGINPFTACRVLLLSPDS